MVGTTETVGLIYFSDVAKALHKVLDPHAKVGTRLDGNVVEGELARIVNANCSEIGVRPVLMEQAKDMGGTYLGGFKYHPVNGGYVKR